MNQLLRRQQGEFFKFMQKMGLIKITKGHRQVKRFDMRIGKHIIKGALKPDYAAKEFGALRQYNPEIFY